MNHYDETAHLYNTRYAEEQNLKMEAAVRNLGIKKQSTVVDMGCGTGLLLSKTETAGTVVCLDLSKGMLKKARNNTTKSANTHLIQADADYTPLSSGEFDLAFAITLLQNMPNPGQTLREMKRITKPNARLIITGLKKHFTKQSFLQLLSRAELDTQLLDADDNLKCYIATCRKRRFP